MRRFWILAALSPAAISCAVPPAASTAEMNVGGRVVTAPDGALRFGWPAVYFEQRFRGTGVTATVETDTEIFRLYVDGKDRGMLKPGSPTLRVAGLAQGEHVARLEKLTESQSGGAVFRGFAIDGVALPTPRRALGIEFIGDSHSVGYGNMSATRSCTEQEVHDATDTQQAFGPLVAKRLNAEYRVNAYSGAGVVRNYDGFAPEQNLPILYARAIPGEPAAAEADGWHPQHIVIDLGTNDFSTPVHAGEAWADAAALHAAYQAGYVAFVRRLMSEQPQAQLILMGSDAFFADVEKVAAAVNRDASKPVATLRVGALAMTGCNWHPSLEDHRRLADLVEHSIRKLR